MTELPLWKELIDQAMQSIRTRPALSPAAQAVLNASNLHPCKDSYLILSAALRAAADQVHHHWDGAECVDYLCAIATELEGG